MFCSPKFLRPLSARFFQVKRAKVLLLKDHPHLGFSGEYVFVKPAYALNTIVRKNIGIITTDPRCKEYESKIDQELLKEKQKIRLYNIYVEKLLKIVLNYRRPVSQINEKVALQPVTKTEVLNDLQSKYGVKVEPNNLSISQDIEMIGDHYTNTRFFSPYFQKEFSFTFIVRLASLK